MASGLGVCLASLLVVADVMGRWLANAPIRGADELQVLALIVAVAASFPAVLASRSNISVELGAHVAERLGGHWARLAMRVFADFCTVSFFALATWQLARTAHSAQLAGETTSILTLQVGPVYYAAAGLFALATVAAAVAAFGKRP